MISIYLVTYFSAILILFLYLKTRDIMHYGIIISILYIISFPLKYLLTLNHISVHNSLVLGDVLLNHVLWLTFVANILLLLPAIFYPSINVRKNMRDSLFLRDQFSYSNRKIILFFLWLSIVIFIHPLSLLFHSHSEIQALKSIARGHRQNSSLLFIFDIFVYAFSYFLCSAILSLKNKSDKAFLYVLFILLLLSLIPNSSKTVVMSPCVMLVAMKYYRFQISNFTILIYGLIFLIVITSLQLFMDFGLASFQAMINLFLYKFSRVFDTFDNAAFYAHAANIKNALGLPSFTYESLVGNIPRFLYPSKPLLTGNWYLQATVLPSFGNTAMDAVYPSGYLYSLVPFLGYLGAFLFVLLFGCALQRIYSKAIIYGSLEYQYLIIFIIINIVNIFRNGLIIIPFLVLSFTLFRFFIWVIREVQRPFVKSIGLINER